MGQFSGYLTSINERCIKWEAYGKYVDLGASTTKKHVPSYGAVEGVRKNAGQLIGGCFGATARPPKSVRPAMERCDWYA